MREVLFVCTANISRSPYAERLARHVCAGRDLGFASAGIPGTRDRRMDPNMLAELARRGVDGAGHSSRPVTPELVEGADVVVTMEFTQHMRLIEAWPAHADKVFGLRHLAEAVQEAGASGDFCHVEIPDSMTWDVADPYGQGAATAARCARDIDTLLAPVLSALSGKAVLLPSVPPAAARRWPWSRR